MAINCININIFIWTFTSQIPDLNIGIWTADDGEYVVADAAADDVAAEDDADDAAADVDVAAAADD